MGGRGFFLRGPFSVLFCYRSDCLTSRPWLLKRRDGPVHSTIMSKYWSSEVLKSCFPAVSNRKRPKCGIKKSGITYIISFRRWIPMSKRNFFKIQHKYYFFNNNTDIHNWNVQNTVAGLRPIQISRLGLAGSRRAVFPPRRDWSKNWQQLLLFRTRDEMHMAMYTQKQNKPTLSPKKRRGSRKNTTKTTYAPETPHFRTASRELRRKNRRKRVQNTAFNFYRERNSNVNHHGGRGKHE